VGRIVNGSITTLQRVALWVLVLGSTMVGLWALAAPQSFYDDFPGMGRVWVAVDGPYNEHLVRDVGALNLALAFVAAMALVSGSALVARAAGGAALIYGVPHFAYHALHLDPFDTGDSVAMLVSLGFNVAAAIVAIGPIGGRETAPDPTRAAAGGTLEG
jgi:hypothetical protein